MTLKGLQIAVTAYDLEQSEHRGIAVYSKALIRCLRLAGAQVWLLTEVDPTLKGRGIRRLPRQTRQMIQQASVLNSLNLGQQDDKLSFLERKFKLARDLRLWRQRVQKTRDLITRPKQFKAEDITRIPLDGLLDSPYPRVERLSYLQDLEGLLCIAGIFQATQQAAKLNRLQPVSLDLPGIDVLITTCPLNLITRTPSRVVQTVHDLIPLEYVAHNEDPLMFSHRLQACLRSKRLYVSTPTQEKYHRHISTLTGSTRGQALPFIPEVDESVVIQPPSLRFPSWLTIDDQQVSDLRPGSYLLRQAHQAKATSNQASELDPDEAEVLKPIAKRKSELKPFRYFLFNSSVEARKNLLFLARAYAESELSSIGIKLCVTGKLKGDDYSRAVQEIVRHEPGIILTGYVDESTKLDLYLNAMGLLSPSLVEGFGIPVLDAACLGMPAIASDCASHIEISALHDFDQCVTTVNTLRSRDWASAMQAVAGLESERWRNAPAERRRRISRYEPLAKGFYQQLQRDLETLLN